MTRKMPADVEHAVETGDNLIAADPTLGLVHDWCHAPTNGDGWAWGLASIGSALVLIVGLEVANAIAVHSEAVTVLMLLAFVVFIALLVTAVRAELK